MSVTRRFKNYFLRGLAVLLPTIVTIWIFVWAYTFIHENISVHINHGLVRLIVLVAEDHIDVSDEQVRNYLLAKQPELRDNPGLLDMNMRRADIRQKVRIEHLEKTWVEGPGAIAGFLIAFIAVLLVGALLASVVGRAVWRMIENFIMNAPFLRRVYPYVKQVTDFVLTPEEQAKLFSKVVALEYPRKGIWSIGFVTGSGLKKVAENVEKEFLTILVPNSPTPITGYVIMVPKEQTIALDMTIEEAFRFTISAGVIAPDNQRMPAALPALSKTVLENGRE